jgi:hypothetical protein
MFDLVDDDANREQKESKMDVNAGVTEAAAESGGIEELLADLDMSDAGDDTAEVIESLEADESVIVERLEAREAAYEDQVVTTADVPSADAVTAEKPAEKKTRKASTTPKEPKAPRDLNSIAPEFFVIADGVTDLDANKAHVIGLMPKQKKIAEKFENVFRSVSAGKAPSEFVKITFGALKAAGTATQTDLVAALKAADYSEGTARSQAGQIMALFNIIGVAKRENQTLTFNPDAPMTKRLSAVC